MYKALSAIKDTLPISSFGSPQAEQIFRDVRTSGAKVVFKDDMPECVLLSPETYTQLIEAGEDALLAEVVLDRMSRFDMSKTLSAEEVYAELGVEDSGEDVEFE